MKIKELLLENIADEFNNIISEIINDPALLDYFASFKEILPIYKKETNNDISNYYLIEKDKDFEFWFRYTYTPRIINEIINTIKIKFINDYINIYRVIEIPNINAIKLNNLGIHWSFDELSAYPYHADFNSKNKQYLLHAIAKNNAIDWKETIITNIINPNEKEVKLFKNMPITLLNITDYDSKEKYNIDISKKIFKT